MVTCLILREQPGAVELGGLVELARDVLQRGQVDQRRAAHVHPGGRDHHRDHRHAGQAGARRLDPLRDRQVKVAQHVVEQAVARVVEVGEQQQRRGGRQHHRQVDQAAQVSLGVPQFVEQDGHEERHGVADDQRQDGELQRVPPGRPEGRVVEDALVVRPAGPAGHAQPALLEAHHDLAARSGTRRRRRSRARRRSGTRARTRCAWPGRPACPRRGIAPGTGPRACAAWPGQPLLARIWLTWLVAVDRSWEMFAFGLVSTSSMTGSRVL